jgi:predicted glycoside hydrolase/deacetylase ChbG (UPF0249 family)
MAAPSQRFMKISFVYPMFNEIGNVETVIRSTHALGKRVLEAFEIIVVNDASTDGCGTLADGLKSLFPELRVIHHERNRKLGGSLKTGFAAAQMDYVLYMDSDIPVAFAEVEQFLARLAEPVDMIIGYRLGKAENLFRVVQSHGYNLLLQACFGMRVRDPNFAFKLFRRELVNLPPRSESSFIDAELILEARRLGYRIRQVGFHYQVRQAGVSTLGSPRVIPKLLRDLVAYRKARVRRTHVSRRDIIFNADDFGLCASINAGVIASHRRGLVRSSSLICTGDAFEEAADYAVKNPSLDTGLHLSLVDGAPISDPRVVPTLVRKDGRFHSSYASFLTHYLSGKIDLADVDREFRAQLRRAADAGLHISHLDSHQHLHVLPAILEIAIRLANENGIPTIRHPDESGAVFRFFTWRFKRAVQALGLQLTCRMNRGRLAEGNVHGVDHFLGMMDAGRWNRESLPARIRSLPEGLTEICCHPRSEPVTEAAYDWGYQYREELDVLTCAELPELLHQLGVNVTSFAEYFGLRRSSDEEIGCLEA